MSLTTSCPGAMIIGSQIGAKKAFDMHYVSFDWYLHNQETCEQFWKEVGKEMEASWRVEPRLGELKE